ncbi:integrase [Halovibrio salipaludis]|uniref:Integrase n=1 Tax=Halovibrio salipaludis TaxID=2032626 RepID=A0A2A2F910_9GAMM|nr:site-specific integrase [Halovibrio salipaludis]PAU81053.1 integrase [Halovibrio salipaludis]
MPRKAQRLTTTAINKLQPGIGKDGKPYNRYVAVGGVSGLMIEVAGGGGKSWVLRTTVGRKRRHIGLGGYPDVPLGQAREKAQAIKDKISQGIDPVEEKRAARRALIAEQLSSITFDQAADEYIRMKEKEFRNPRQRQQWANSLRDYATPHIGDTPVKEIDLAHIKAVLDPIWESKTETANRIRARMENILGWCAIHGYREGDNPARWSGYLDEVYPSPEKIKKRGHHAAMAVEDLPEFMGQLRQRDSTAAMALRFLILTATRTNEVIGDKRIGKSGITWKEIDLASRIWTVPAERMKTGKEHTIPLCDEAVAILQSVPQGGPDDLVFAGPKGDIPSNNFLSSLLKRMEVPVTAHGFRSTFKDWARKHTGYADEVSELALAHVNTDATRAAYARSGLIEKRRQLMGDWERFTREGLPQDDSATVTPIGEARA